MVLRFSMTYQLEGNLALFRTSLLWGMYIMLIIVLFLKRKGGGFLEKI